MFPFAYQYPNKEMQGLCICNCHGGDPDRPKAVESRLCRGCAEERFQSWESLVNVLVRDD